MTVITAGDKELVRRSRRGRRQIENLFLFELHVAGTIMWHCIPPPSIEIISIKKSPHTDMHPHIQLKGCILTLQQHGCHHVRKNIVYPSSLLAFVDIMCERIGEV